MKVRELVGSIVAHVNEDHAEAALTYARVFTEFADVEEAQMVGVDRLGMTLSCRVGEGWHLARVEFKEPLADARRVLVLLAKRARERLAGD